MTVCSELETQFDVFDSEMLRDKNETQVEGLDLSDPAEIFHFLNESARENGFAAHFLGTHILSTLVCTSPISCSDTTPPVNVLVTVTLATQVLNATVCLQRCSSP